MAPCLLHLKRQSEGKFLTNFQGHWSIQIFDENKALRGRSIHVSPELQMDYWHQKLSESSGLHRYRSINYSSLQEENVLCKVLGSECDKSTCRVHSRKNCGLVSRPTPQEALQVNKL